MTHQASLRVWRGDDDGGALQDFTVEVNEGEVVLDIIHRLQATQAPDLAVRWNCKAGKCGSCSAEVNGRPRLLCMTRMSTFAEGRFRFFVVGIAGSGPTRWPACTGMSQTWLSRRPNWCCRTSILRTAPRCLRC